MPPESVLKSRRNRCSSAAGIRTLVCSQSLSSRLVALFDESKGLFGMQTFPSGSAPPPPRFVDGFHRFGAAVCGQRGLPSFEHQRDSRARPRAFRRGGGGFPGRRAELVPRGGGRAYFTELRPNKLPSVSSHRVTQPNSPMENFGRTTFPPAATMRDSSFAQSSTLKYTNVPRAPGRAWFDSRWSVRPPVVPGCATGRC